MAPLAAAAQPAGPPAAALAPQPIAPAMAMPAATAAHPTHFKGDPLEGFNRKLFALHEFLDRLLFRPLAMAYKTVVPKVVRGGIRHVFSNVGEPIVFVNDMLQLKPKRAVRTVARFAINSTIGIGGLIDVAKTDEFKLPHHGNGFGNTLGRYGIGPGPYLFLPFVGPTDLRDFGSAPVDGAVLPLAIGFPFDRAAYQIPQGVLVGLDTRAESDADLKALLGGAVDRYATLRSAYLQTRAATVYELRHGHGAVASPLDDPLTDPAAPQRSDSRLAVPNRPARPDAPAVDLSDPLAAPAAPVPQAGARPEPLSEPR